MELSALSSRRVLRLWVFAIIVVAAVLRLVTIQAIPPGIWYDEAIYALDGWEASTGKLRIFYTTEDHMREPLYIWSLGAWFAMVGHSVAKARVLTALWGIGTVAAFWAIARRAFRGSDSHDSTRSLTWALAALLAFACFRWHLHFSRSIFRAATPPLFVIGTLWGIFKLRETGRWHYAAVAGAIAGAGLYTYLSFRLMPILLGIWFVYLWFTKRWTGRHLAVFAAVSIAVVTPLTLDWYKHPDHFHGRTEEISLSTKQEKYIKADGTEDTRTVAKAPLEIAKAVADNCLSIALMWNWKGDHVGKHNLPHEPVFDPINGVIFLLGVAYCLRRWRTDEWAFLALSWIAVFSIASALSFGAPNILRMQAMSPAAILVWLFGLRWFTEWLEQKRPGRLGAAVAGVLLTGFCGYQLVTYFVLFPRSPEVRQEFQYENFYVPSESVRRFASQDKPPRTIHVPQELAEHPNFRFITAGLENKLSPYGAEGWNAGAVQPGDAVVITLRSQQLAAATAKRDIKSELVQIDGARVADQYPIHPAKGPAFVFGTLWIIPRK